MSIINFITGCICSRLADTGLANLLNVESLKHGTHPLAYLKIRWEGGKPKAAGVVGSGYGAYDTDGYFFVFKENVPLLVGLIRPREHAWRAAMYRVRNQFNGQLNGLHIGLFISSGLLSALITPTLNFRFRKEEIIEGRFENDPDYSGSAYRTKRKIEAWRIGFLGTLLTGLNQDYWHRIQENPKRCLKGVVQLTGAAAIAWYSQSSLASLSFIAGALLS